MYVTMATHTIHMLHYRGCQRYQYHKSHDFISRYIYKPWFTRITETVSASVVNNMSYIALYVAEPAYATVCGRCYSRHLLDFYVLNISYFVRD